jgi:hypothetical protein
LEEFAVLGQGFDCGEVVPGAGVGEWDVEQLEESGEGGGDGEWLR